MNEDEEQTKKELIESYRKQRELTPFECAILNAFIIAGITFFSTLSIEYPPTAANIWAAMIGASLALLTQLKTLIEMKQTRRRCRPLGMLI